MVSENELKPVVVAMKEMVEDLQVPKNVRLKIQEVISLLEEDTEMSIKINRSLQQLEEVSDDSNLQSFNRTQVWNLISLLESV